MRFGLVHRVMTDALAALGVLALVASGQFSRPMNIVVCVALAIAVGMREPWRHEAANRHVDTIAVFALVAAQVGRAFFTNASVLDLLIEAALDTGLPGTEARSQSLRGLRRGAAQPRLMPRLPTGTKNKEEGGATPVNRRQAPLAIPARRGGRRR